MDPWDDDDAFRVARDLHGGPGVSAMQTSTTANCGLARAPMAALDALIETAWSFPSFRVSYGAFDGPRAIRFHASAGSESQAALDGIRVDLSDAPRLIEALRNADAPVAFEDSESDSRMRPIAPAFAELGARSLLILPIRREREIQPFGIVMMDRPKPRTWGPKEGAALDRMGPLIALTLEHVEAQAELESRRTSSARHERRVTAMRGLIAGVATDAQRLLGALRPSVGDDQTSQSLLGQLERLVHDLDRVQHGPSRLTHPFDLTPVIRELASGLRALTTAKIHTAGFSTELIGVQANRTGVERVLVNLIAHVTRDATSDQGLTLELSHPPDGVGPELRVHGSALHLDDALTLIGGGERFDSAAEIDPELWQVRCEALLQDIRLRLEDGALVLEFPPAALHSDAAKTTG
ncbi:MAG: hypothetical protein ACRBN8_41220 [Nannocystales bacterium]